MSKAETTWRVMGCVLVMALGGCRSAETRIYTLAPAAPATHILVYNAPPLHVDTVNVPAGWDRIEILKPSANGALQISDFDHWAAPLGQMARQTLSDDLDLRLPLGSVIYPRLAKPSSALGVNVDILEFDVLPGQASMRASWVIVPSGDVQGGKRNAAELHTSVGSEDPTALVRAWGNLIGQLADRIAADAASFDLP